jgi:hypothetical protein
MTVHCQSGAACGLSQDARPDLPTALLVLPNTKQPIRQQGTAPQSLHSSLYQWYIVQLSLELKRKTIKSGRDTIVMLLT